MKELIFVILLATLLKFLRAALRYSPLLPRRSGAGFTIFYGWDRYIGNINNGIAYGEGTF